MPTPVQERLQADLKAALRSREKPAVDAIRCVLAAIANAEAVDAGSVAKGVTEVPRRALTEADVRALVEAEHRDLTESAAELRAHGRADEADILDTKAVVVASYLSA
jgi:uncharacterized protein YqeY